MDCIVRPLTSADLAEWRRMRFALWPHMTASEFESESAAILAGEAHDHVFVAQGPEGSLCGFAEVSLRDVAEGCETRGVGYLEGLWADPDARQRGVARALVGAAEDWARAKGCCEFASDTEIGNERSIAVHGRLGFEEVGRIVVFRKSIDGPG